MGTSNFLNIEDLDIIPGTDDLLLDEMDFINDIDPESFVDL